MPVTGQQSLLSSILGINFARAHAKPEIFLPNSKSPVKRKHWLWDKNSRVHTGKKKTELDDE